MDPRKEQEIAASVIAKEQSKKPSKIEVETDFEILDHKIYKKAIAKEVKKIYDRPAPASGLRYKRNAFDELRESGILHDTDKLIGEFKEVLLKVSAQPKRIRQAIAEVCMNAFWGVKEKFNVKN